jgi:CHAT domain-containing protein
MRHLAFTSTTPLWLLAALTSAVPAWAVPISVRDSFRIGSSGSSYCTAQSDAADPALSDMFDSGYTITCRDAVLPIGKLYKLRNAGSAAGRLAAARTGNVVCDAERRETVPDLGDVAVLDCRLKDFNVGYRVYQLTKGRGFYAAEGLAGYDSALILALRSLVIDAPAKGEVKIATIGLGDPAAFARIQAGTLDPAKALDEAYRRNNAGSYAEAAEFFAAVSNAEDGPVSRIEGLANEALQKSNLGRFAEAEALFQRAESMVNDDPIVARRLRNYRAIHYLNRGDVKSALEQLDKPMPMTNAAVQNAAMGMTVPNIDAATAKRLNSESKYGKAVGNQSDELLPAEKAEILDGQATQLRGTSLRLQGKSAEASAALTEAARRLEAVRGGKVTSILWMRAQILGDLAAIAEEAGNQAQAEKLFREGVSLLEVNYPGSAALLTAKARLAGYLNRVGQTVAAEELFREIVQSQPDTSNLPPSFANVLRPYVDLLIARGDDPAAAADIFAATQLMVRPGLAQTQAVLARELNGGTDEAARLFRQAVTLSRQVERSRIELARYADLPQPSPEEQARARVLRASLSQAEKEQLATQSELGSFPRYRAVSGNVITLADFQKSLREGEAYYLMTVVGNTIYANLITTTSVKARKLDVTAKQLSEEVDALRETISTIEDGQRTTYPFDVGLSHQIYTQLFGPFDAELRPVRHFIFEPDGAMLRLPPNLLVMDQASVDAYAKRSQAGGDAEFDFRGTKWFGRDRDISTAVSPSSFALLRAARPSNGTKEYLGLGNNSPPGAGASLSVPATADRDCLLPMSSWDHPISPKELQTAGAILSKSDPGGITILTRDQFTDTSLKERTDLDQYRVLHFATHGVVTSRAAKCAAQPALLTSFGGAGSDGLLTFREIFDLKLDADLVVLSACDTAGKASVAATQQAGLSTGGDVALDGLVRAFVGAGGRLVVASHWPVPDDFNATQRLITGLFSSKAGTPTATALREAQIQLMDDINTSHPFYWSAFAVVGDGETPIIRNFGSVAQKN